MDDEDLNEELGKLMRSLPTRGLKGDMVSTAYLFIYAFSFDRKHRASSHRDEECLKVIACVIMK